MDETKDILILRYLNDELSAAEKSTFEKALGEDGDLQASLAQYQNLIQGVVQTERVKIKAKIAATTAVIPKSTLKSYQPNPPKGGASFGSVFRSFFLISSGLLIAGTALLYFDVFPFENPAVKKMREKLLELENIGVIQVDTIYQTIETTTITKDTVIYGREEAKEFLERLEGEPFE